MSKINRLFSRFLTTLVALLLVVSEVSTVSAATFTENKESTATSQQETHIDISNYYSPILLTKGKTYILSYVTDGDGWKFSEIRFFTKLGGWITCNLEDGRFENMYLRIEKYAEDIGGQVSLKIYCKSNTIRKIISKLENEITGQTKTYSSAITVQTNESDAIQNLVTVSSKSETSYDKGNNNCTSVPVQPIIPEVPDKPVVPDPPIIDNPVTPTPPVVEGPKKIDTSGWIFDAVSEEYDGTEHSVEVAGLPSYVTPVYTNNGQTDVGTYTVTVSFEVPDGYEKPADMQTTLTIEKATVSFTDKNVVLLEEGGFSIMVPYDKLPAGTSCKYYINGVESDESNGIKDTGIYVITAELEVPAEEADNYNVDEPVKAIFNAQIPDSETICPYKISLDKTSDDAGNVKITVSTHYNFVGYSIGTIRFTPVYDKEKLILQESIANDKPDGDLLFGMSLSSGNFYGSSRDRQNGLRDGAEIVTYVFKVADDTTDAVFNITNVEIVSILNPVVENVPGTGTIINPTVEIQDIELPYDFAREQEPYAISQKESASTMEQTTLSEGEPKTDTVVNTKEEALLDEESKTEATATLDVDTTVEASTPTDEKATTGEEHEADAASDKEPKVEVTAPTEVPAIEDKPEVGVDTPAEEEVTIEKNSEPEVFITNEENPTVE